MNTKNQMSCSPSEQDATPRLVPGRVPTTFLTAAIIAALGMMTTLRADRVDHDIAAGNVTVTTSNPPTNEGTELSLPLWVNSFGIINNYNISDHKIIIGDVETDDAAGGILISAIAENLRNNWGSNMTHTLSMAVVNSGQSYEVATQSVPLNSAASMEDNVNFASAWFPFDTWLCGRALNSVNSGVLSNFVASPGIEWGVHFIDSKATNGPNGTAYLDLRSFGIDSRRDGVLLVNHGKNEANYALSYINNADDEMDGTWTIYVHDNRANGRSYEQDPIAFVFVPRTVTSVVSGMFMGDGSISMYSGSAPEFTVEWRTDIANGTYELKIPGRSPNDGVLIISAAGGDANNGDNIVTYQANAAGDGWIIQSRDLPNAGLQSLPATEPVCSFVFIPAERPGITVTPSKNVQTTENGGMATFTVTLNGYPKPTADVTVNLTSSDPGEGIVSPSFITFRPEDWNVPMYVLVTGVDDFEVDGTQPYTINLSTTTSADPNFNGLVPENVGVINIDNEAGISVDASRITTTEAGGTATFSVWLNTPPSADVTLAISSSDLTEATVSPASLTFTPADYFSPQTVTVTGVDDAVQDGPAAYFVVTASATSADPAYNNFNALDIQGENLDNDVAQVIIPAGKLVVTEPNGTAQFPVALASEPTADVTISFETSDSTEATVTASVTFTPANWNTPQNVTVTAADDMENDGPIDFSITTSVTSTDPIYAAIDPDDLVGTTFDNEADFALPSGDRVYGIGDGPMGIDSYATIVDETPNYDGGSLTVTLTAGGSSTDRLDLRNDGTGPGQIGVSGSTITYEGVQVGTKSGGTGTTALSIAFNAAATPTAAQAVTRAVTYQNVDANATPQTRTVSFALADGDGGVSTAVKTIVIRLMRVYTFQQDADGGFGVYTNAGDVQVDWESWNTTWPAGISPTAGIFIDFAPGGLPQDQSQAFLKFTNIFGTAAGQIPAGARIVSADIILNVTDSGHGALFNRMLIDWDQDFATYASFGDGVQLDDIEAVSGTNAFFMDQANNTTSGAGQRQVGVTADVQAWASGAANYGWCMSPWEGGSNGTGFSPCEATNIVLRPRLRVAWLPPEATSVAAFREGEDGYTGQVDTQIRMVLPDTAYNTATYLSPDAAVNSLPVVNPQQVLIRFDNIIGSGAGQVPAGATIHAAVLDLTSITADAQGNGGQFHALLNPWNDTDTWNTWLDGIAADGIDAALTPTATLPVEGQGETVQPTRYAVELTADVQAWVNGTANNGWAILPWPGGNNGWGFNSAEADPLGTRPQLRVYYTPGSVQEEITIQPPVYNGGNVQLSFNGTVGRTYSVQRIGTLGATWATIGTATVEANGTATFTDNSPLAGAAFYRVIYP